MSSGFPVVQVSLEFESSEFASGLVEGLKRPCPIESPAREAELVETVRSLLGADESTIRHELGKIVGWILRDPTQAYGVVQGQKREERNTDVYRDRSWAS